MHRQPRYSLCLRAISLFAMAASLAVIGCMSSSSDIKQDIPAKTAPIKSSQRAIEEHYVDPESTPHSELKVRWRDAKDLSRATLDSSAGLVVDVQNATPKEVNGRLFLVTAGLDSRRIKRPLQDFKLSPKGSLEVIVPVEALSIQSENSTSRVRLHAEIHRANGTTVQSFTPPLYYRFQQGYAKAQFFNELDLGDLDTTNLDLFDVRGRIKEADGTWTDAAVAAAATAEEASRTGGGRVGLTAFGRARADATDPRRGSNIVPPKELAAWAPDQSPFTSFWMYSLDVLDVGHRVC